ncbi:MAG: GNAT family N-acetyltransferase [Planctomycetota bacterium]|nr:GNAT family N-acetyltransferase [Planctomycetota bacterium]
MTSIRLATPEDADAVLAIYTPVVENTWVSFEFEAPARAELAQRIASTLARAPWIVAEEEGVCLGYAYAVPFRARPAYCWSLEVSVYVHHDHHRRGVARALYEALFALLRRQGFQRLIAGIALPNEASVTLHESFGFRPVGTFDRVGHKLGDWRAVGFWDLALCDLDAQPAELRTVEQALIEAEEDLIRAAASIRPSI